MHFAAQCMHLKIHIYAMQNTMEWKSSVYCFEPQGVLSLLVHLKCSFMEAFGKRLPKQESELKINKAVMWQTIFHPLSFPNWHPSHELWDVRQLPIRDTQQLQCEHTMPGLYTHHSPQSISLITFPLCFGKTGDHKAQIAWLMGLMFAEHSSLSNKVSKEPPCCFVWGGEVTAQFSFAQSSHTKLSDAPNIVQWVCV